MPVPIFTNSPIASKPSGVTPKTATPESSDNAPPTITTAPTASKGSYPSARPGAAPSLPTPTAAAQAYTPQPTPTSAVASESPPPPQPGAAPVPPGAARSTIPPPPKVGEKYQPPAPAHQQKPTTSAPTAAIAYPPQMSIPAPAVAYPAQQHGTLTAAGPSPVTHAAGGGGTASTNMTFAGYGGQNLQHPPGYQQDANASALDRYQGTTASAAAAAAVNREGQHSSEEGGVWDAAKKWAQATGQKLAVAENEVWKRINKE